MEVALKKRLLLGLVAGLGVLAVPVAAGASVLPSQSACVVVQGPNGVTVQVGYAPDGPSGCTAL